MDNTDDSVTFDRTDNPDASLAGTGGLADALDNPGMGGDPTASGLTAGGTGTALGHGDDQGGAGGAGGGMVDRVGGISTTGGEMNTTPNTVGQGIPAPPENRDKYEI